MSDIGDRIGELTRLSGQLVTLNARAEQLPRDTAECYCRIIEGAQEREMAPERRGRAGVTR